MREIAKYIGPNGRQSGCVSLVANGQAQNLQRQFGFGDTVPDRVGMSPKRIPASPKPAIAYSAGMHRRGE